MKVSFFTRGNKLQVRVPQNGIYVRLSTGIEIPDYLRFTASKQLVSGSSIEAQEINSEITRHRKFIGNVINQGLNLKAEYDAFQQPIETFIDNGDYEIINLCRQFIANATSGEIKSKKGARYSQSTLSNYNFVVNTLSDYAASAPKLDLLAFNLSNIQDIPTKTKIASKWKEWFNGFIQYMTDFEFMVNSKALVMTNIKTIVYYYQKKYFLLLPEIPSVKSYQLPVVALPEGFSAKFMADKLYDRLNGDEKFVWEACATMLYTSLRVGDAVSLKWSDLTDIGTGLLMQKWNKKTGALSAAPLPKRLETIFRNNVAHHGDIFSPATGNRMAVIYKCIKGLFFKYPELHQVLTASVVDSDGVFHTTSKPIYQWVTPHMLRKTAITTMKRLGMEDATIKLLSGHAERSKAYERYVAYDNVRHNSDFEKYISAMNNA